MPDVCRACAAGSFADGVARRACVPCPRDAWQNVIEHAGERRVPSPLCAQRLGRARVCVCICTTSFVGRGVGAACGCVACAAGHACPRNRTQRPCPTNS